MPAFSRSSYENEFWLPLIEKAYAKLHGGYHRIEKIGLREAINDLTGLEPEIIQFIQPAHVNEDNFLFILQLLQDNQSVVGFMRAGEVKIKSGLATRALENSVYIFDSVDIAEKQIFIINPWWGNEVKPEENQLLKLTLPEFFQTFNTVVILKDKSDEWRGIKFEISLNPSNGIPQQNNLAWVNNPQYAFEVLDKNQNTSIYAQLQLISGVQSVRPCFIGFMIFSINEKEMKIKTLVRSRMKAKAISSYSFDEKFAFAFCQLEKGKYVIVPFCNVINHGGVYLQLEVYYDCKDFQLKFFDRFEKVCDTCTEKTAVDSQYLRILKDRLNKEALPKYNVNVAKELAADMRPWYIVWPQFIKMFIIKNPILW